MPLKTHIDETPTLNLTSLIDVLLLLVIFFMMATKFSEPERKISLQVPAVTDRASLAPAVEKRIVNVYRTGRLTLDDASVSLEELTSRLTAARSQYKDVGVLVRGDAEGPFQNVANVLAACHRAGISRLAVSVKLTTTER